MCLLSNGRQFKTISQQIQSGYSGHDVWLAISYAAAALGITSLESILPSVEPCMVQIKLLQWDPLG
jgi:hypothetical protein